MKANSWLLGVGECACLGQDWKLCFCKICLSEGSFHLVPVVSERGGVSRNVMLTAVSQRALPPPTQSLSRGAINNLHQEHGQICIILKAQDKVAGA